MVSLIDIGESEEKALLIPFHRIDSWYFHTCYRQQIPKNEYNAIPNACRNQNLGNICFRAFPALRQVNHRTKPHEKHQQGCLCGRKPGVVDQVYKDHQHRKKTTRQYPLASVPQFEILFQKYSCKKKKANLKYIPLDSTGRITVEAFQKTLSSKTKVVALTYVSNVMGYITPIEEITKIAHERGIIVVVDAAQAVPHMRIDVASLDCDFLAFSAHKMMGPTGFGILYGKYKYLKKMKPVEYGGDMIDIVEKYSNITKDAPFKFETGTPPVAEAIAFKEAIRYIEAIGYDKIKMHEETLLQYAKDKLSQIEGITVYNMTTETGIIAFNINKAHPHDAATIFDENHIALRAGHHCAQLTIKWLECVGTLRACIYIYNDYSDIDKFVEAVKEAAKYFEEW